MNCPLITCIIVLVVPLKFVLYLSHEQSLNITEAMGVLTPEVVRWLKKLREIHMEMLERFIAGDAVSLF